MGHSHHDVLACCEGASLVNPPDSKQQADTIVYVAVTDGSDKPVYFEPRVVTRREWIAAPTQQ